MLHIDLKVEKWKELCFYNQRDFDTMFTKEQSDELLHYHNDRVIKVRYPADEKRNLDDS